MSSRLEHLEAALSVLKELVKAERDSLKACDRRGAMDQGSSRAKMTTLNARWAILAEYRDRTEQRFLKALKDAGYLT